MKKVCVFVLFCLFVHVDCLGCFLIGKSLVSLGGGGGGGGRIVRREVVGR